jgi:hypothetical protein
MLKQFKIITLAPTCFGSRRNHHQGAVLCLAQNYKVWFSFARRYRRSQCYGGISAWCAGVRFTMEACFLRGRAKDLSAPLIINVDCVSLALVIQHAKRMRPIVLSSVVYLFFNTFSQI